MWAMSVEKFCNMLCKRNEGGIFCPSRKAYFLPISKKILILVSKPYIFASEYQIQFPFMVEIKKNISKEIFIQQIVSEIHEIPLIYLQSSKK
jgi:hypothetical protein